MGLLSRLLGTEGATRDLLADLSEDYRAEAVAGVRTAAERLGLALCGEAESVLPGPKGNREVFVYLSRSTGGRCA